MKILLSKTWFYLSILKWRIIYALQDIPYRITASKRQLPDFVIIGVTKGGTTSLFHYLNQHPEVRMSRRKEPLFFSHKYRKGMNYYKSFFPLLSEHKVSGESSTSYFSDSNVPKRLKKELPKAKIIVLLRDPVKRAYSHFQMNKKNDPSKRFDLAIEGELSRMKKGENVVYNYVNKGFYHLALCNWLKYYDLSELLILKSEDFFEDPKQELSKVYAYLGLKEIFPGDLLPQNQRDYDPINQIDYDGLKAIYKEDARKLKELLGARFTW